jgi:hypothetical protein
LELPALLLADSFLAAGLEALLPAEPRASFGDILGAW